MICRHCGGSADHLFLDLGHAPLSNGYLTRDELGEPEIFYPLRLFVCEQCWLVQTEHPLPVETVFRHNYAYFSSTSSSWLEHAASFSKGITERLSLDANSFVIEIACNDGYLLRNFVASGIPCLGIEPTAGTAAAAEELGIPVFREFFCRGLGERLGREGKKGDLIVGNNVFAHVPDSNDFAEGMKAALKTGGTITLEFPHLMRLMESVQFDTVYHEHFSYFSLFTAASIFSRVGLRIFHVEELPTHGGSLRIYGCHHDDPRPVLPSVPALLRAEEECGLRSFSTYRMFQSHACRIKDDLLAFLIECKRTGVSVAGYGAAAKGCTLLNFAGVKPDLLPFVCDAAPSKQGKFLPGSHIPILHPSALAERRPDIVLILPWNISEEVLAQHRYISGWGGRFAVAVPELKVISP